MLENNYNSTKSWALEALFTVETAYLGHGTFCCNDTAMVGCLRRNISLMFRIDNFFRGMINLLEF
ncbi:MAG TPA: hypothetical protein EYH36_03770 [Desulfocapsa sulfexigens]|nr:hypothetical protein [Desulfocapsa sulfexigens]